MEEGLSKKERRALRREEKEREMLTAGRKNSAAKFFKLFSVLVVIAGAVYGIYYLLTLSGPEGEDFSEAVSILDRSHVTPGTEVMIYNSNPPTSGPHWPNPAPRGIHDEEIPDEFLVHNLEHGEVWISYHPGLSDGAKKELLDFAGSFSKVVITPRAKNDTDIALAAWGRLDKFNLTEGKLDTKRIEDFVKRYRNKGPELVP